MYTAVNQCEVNEGGKERTVHCGLAPALAPAREDEPPRLHPRKVVRGFEPEARVGAQNDHGFARQVRVRDRLLLSELVFDDIPRSEVHRD